MHNITSANEENQTFVRSYRFEEADTGERDTGFFVTIVKDEVKSLLSLSLNTSLLVIPEAWKIELARRKKRKYEKSRYCKSSQSMHSDRYLGKDLNKDNLSENKNGFKRNDQGYLSSLVPWKVLYRDFGSKTSDAAEHEQAESPTLLEKEISTPPSDFASKSPYIVTSGSSRYGKRPFHDSSNENPSISSEKRIAYDRESSDNNKRLSKKRIASERKSSRVAPNHCRTQVEKDVPTLTLDDVAFKYTSFTYYRTDFSPHITNMTNLKQERNVVGIFGLRYSVTDYLRDFPTFLAKTFDMLLLKKDSACVNLVWHDQQKYGDLQIFTKSHSEESHLHLKLNDQTEKHKETVQYDTRRVSFTEVAFSFPAEFVNKHSTVFKLEEDAVFNLASSIISLTSKQFSIVEIMFSSLMPSITLESTGNTKFNCSRTLPTLKVSITSTYYFALEQNMYVRREENNCFIQIRKNPYSTYSEFGIGVAKVVQPCFCYRKHKKSTIAFSKDKIHSTLS